MSELTGPGVTESIEEIRANTMRMLELLGAGKQTTQGFAPIWRDEVEMYPSHSAVNTENDPGSVETAP